MESTMREYDVTYKVDVIDGQRVLVQVVGEAKPDIFKTPGVLVRGTRGVRNRYYRTQGQPRSVRAGWNIPTKDVPYWKQED
jgi:hypothetical protein